VALKSGQDLTSNQAIEEALDALDLQLDRLKTLYEQYFLGIQKQAPAFIHNDVERKLRDLTQMNLRNTRLRYRLATLTQKFGSYNSYWRRTLRQIENGTYARNLAKIGREAAKKGADIPEEILAAMPKRMREQVLRDRDAAIAMAKLRNQIDDATVDDNDEPAAIISAPPPRENVKPKSGAHVLSEDDADIDFDQLFSAFQDDAPKKEEPAKKPISQQITQMIPRPARNDFAKDDPTDENFAFDLDAAEKIPSTQQIPRQTSAIPRPTVPAPSQSTAIPKPLVPGTSTTAVPRPPLPPQHPVARQTGPVPIPAVSSPTSAIPRPVAPSQASKPVPVAPGSAQRTQPVQVESMSGPFPRAQTPPPTPRPTPQIPKPPPTQPIPKPALKPPPGMTEADVNALHAKYVQAKQAVGEKVDAGSREKLLRTINQTAPKIMEQYKASGVDFSVVVKDNQVVIKAKPKS
jgi:hypothetical protein